MIPKLFFTNKFYKLKESQFVYSTDSNVQVPDVNHDVLFREGLDHMVSYASYYFFMHVLYL